MNELEKKVQFEVFSRHSDIVVVEGIFLSLQEFFFLVGRASTSLWEKSSGALDIPNYFQLSNFKLWFQLETVHGNTLEKILQNPLQVPESYHKKTPQKIYIYNGFLFRVHLA